MIVSAFLSSVFVFVPHDVRVGLYAGFLSRLFYLVFWDSLLSQNFSQPNILSWPYSSFVPHELLSCLSVQHWSILSLEKNDNNQAIINSNKQQKTLYNLNQIVFMETNFLTSSDGEVFEGFKILSSDFDHI